MGFVLKPLCANLVVGLCGSLKEATELLEKGGKRGLREVGS